jgi:undecaprenyl-diphosphatase
VYARSDSPAQPPLAVPLAALAGFGVLLALTIGGWVPLDEWDASISEWFRAYGDQRPNLIEVIRIGTDVAATIPFLIAGLLVSLALAGRRDFRPAFLCATVTVAVPLLWGLMHWGLHHPRPTDGFVLVESNGFPSGHTSNAAAAALVAVLLLWPRQDRTGRAVTVGLAVAFAAAVGLTRLALLAHWPADVLGGWLLALAVVPLAARAAHRVVPARISDRPANPRVPAG